MAEVKSKKVEKIQLDENEVALYLRAEPKFFARHPELLEEVQIKHREGSAVSLMERQADLLRAKNQKLEDKLERLMQAARDNEKRADHVHKLARALIRAPSLAAVAAGLRERLREDFSIDETFIGIAAAVYKRHDIEGLTSVEPEGKLAKGFENFFRTRLIECGPLKESQSKLLFPQAKTPCGSAAIVPLEKEKNLGLIAFGAVDAERFQPRQGKLFLEMIAELVSAAIRARI